MKKRKSYELKPARGQALLNYQNRLTASEMPLFESDVVESASKKGGAGNLLLQGDCLSVCAYLRENGIAVDLVYIDPPFASGADYAKKILLRGGAELENGDSSIGEEIMYGDIWQKEDYLNWLYERLLAIREIMSERASIYVHLDWHIGHYVRVLMDEVFGEDNFVNEIVWAYRSGGASRNGSLARKHDVIYFYAKSAMDFAITPIKERQYLDKPFMGAQEDEQGRFYVDTILTDTLRGVIRRVMPDGSIVEYNTRPVLNLSKERTGYNTQKPEDLIKMLLEIASTEDMVVADFFVGSGTTAAAAHRLNRRFIACDIGLNAIQTTRDRLHKAGADFEHRKIRDGLRLFRNPAQTEKRVFQLIERWQSREEAGLGEFWSGAILGGNGAHIPVAFPGMEQKLTRNYIDVVLEEVAARTDEGEEVEAAVIIYALKAENVDQKYADKAARDSRRTDIRIRLRSIDQLLGDKANHLHAPDSAEIKVKKSGGKCRVTIAGFFSPYLKAKIDEYNASRKQGEVGKKNQLVKVRRNGLELIESVQFDTTLKKGVWTSNPDLEDTPDKKTPVKGEYDVPAEKFRIKIRNIAGDETEFNSDGLKTS